MVDLNNLEKKNSSLVQFDAMRLLRLENLRWSTIVLAISNLVIFLLGGFIIFLAYPNCERHYVLLLLAVSLTSCVRIVTMVQSGIAQEATAKGVLGSPSENTTAVIDTVDRHERRTRYKRWLWWTRFSMFITVLQFVIAVYLIFHIAGYLSQDGTSGRVNSGRWRPKLLFLYTIIVCFVAILQCFMGSDVLRWRSFYLTQDNAWKAHYREVFDHGIREALCCLGRAKYLSVMEEDEVYSVAQLLGDLVAYRSSGTGHLELLAGLALLQRHSQSVKSPEQLMEAPEEQIQDAASLHKFAEAAYTGPLLDLGRNPFLFPCAWLYRQGILSPWSRNSLPKLDGDNWWRGHASAFLNYVKLSPEVLRKGRINQAKCQAAYFVVILHHLKSVVITVRGTETPEDLITDGLCRECILSEEDLDGLLNSSHIHPTVKQKVELSFPHCAHSGIIGAARELFMQIEGNSRNDESEPNSLLSSLMGDGCECHGYKIRIVGHSLGGAIAAMLGLRLYGRYPNLHVYSYGPLPCVDSVVANACSNFVTSIVHNNEFSARLSISSITRLRAAAIKALSEHTEADSTMIFRLARQFLYTTKVQRDTDQVQDPEPDVCYTTVSTDSLNHKIFANDHRETKDETHEFSLWTEPETNDGIITIYCDELTNPFSAGVNSVDDTPSQFRKTVEILENSAVGDPPEMYIPGLLIHIVPEKRRFSMPLWNSWRTQDGAHDYKAYVTNRERFKDITVSPSMFLDHLPWRCQYALEKVLEARILGGISNGSPIM